MLSRVTLTIVIGVMSCGCADSPVAAPDQAARPAATSKRNSAPQPPPVPTIGAHEFRDPREVLVEGQRTVDVMDIAAPARINELAQRLRESVEKNPDWFLEHVKKSKPGEPLPYDSRMNLSPAEYEEFLRLAKQQTVQKIAEGTLTVVRKGPDVYALDGGQAMADLTGIEIDLANDLVRTPFGVLTNRSEVHAREGSALGPWDGIEWKIEDTDPDSLIGTVASFAVGKLRQSGRCVMLYDVKKLSLEGKVRIWRLLYYDVPATK